VWNEVDAATGEHGLATPSGVISTTGVGGLALGGGIGHLSRRCGLTVDNLLAAEVVLADGSLVTASEEAHADLFWAIRGGGGNIGVVTSFSFRCHEIGAVAAGPMFYDIGDVGEVLRWYRDFLPNAPTELSGFFATLSVPTGDPFPEELWQLPVCGIFWCYTGPLDQTDEVFQAVRSFKQPLLDGVAEMPFAQFQSAFDPVYPPGYQWYWRGDFIGKIPDSAVEVHEQFGRTLPTALTTMHLYPLDGVVHQVDSSATAFRFRNAGWAAVIVGVDPDPANAERIKEWTVSYWEALRASSLGGYVNFMMDEGADRMRASYGENYHKLARIKAKYDPGNFFHINQNIPPSAWTNVTWWDDLPSRADVAQSVVGPQYLARLLHGPRSAHIAAVPSADGIARVS
jgi:hypothetical protein